MHESLKDLCAQNPQTNKEPDIYSQVSVPLTNGT